MAENKVPAQSQHGRKEQHGGLSAATRYALTVVIVLGMVLLRWALNPVLGTGSTYITIFPAMMFVAITFGKKPGLVGNILAIILIEYFVVRPAQFLTLSLAVRSAMMLPATFYVGLVGDKLRAALQRAAQEAEAAASANAARREAAEALQQSHERLKKVLEVETVGVMFWDLKSGCMTDANDTFLKLMGYSRQEVEARELTWQKLTPPEYLEVSRAEMRKFQVSGRIGPYEKEYFRKDGKRQWFVFAGSSLGNDTCVEFCVDISEHKQAEEALRASEEQFRILTGNLESGVALIDQHGAFSIVNTAFLNMFGIAQDTGILNVNSHNWSQWQVLDEQGVLLEVDEHPVRKAALTRRATKNRLVAVKPPSGDDLKWLLVSAEPMLNAGGGIHRIICTYYDITERKQAEEALKELNQELEKRVAERTAELREKDRILLLQSRHAAMGEMIGNIAHQWRQPLNTLGLTIQELLLLYDAGEFDRALLAKNVQTSMRLIQYMSSTIEDFVNYFKPDREKSYFSIRDAIAKTLAIVADSFKYHQIEIAVERQDDRQIHGYQNEFAQALLNLLNNARDAFMERGTGEPRVTINTVTENGKALITVADNAGGIPEGIMEKIFDPYFTTKGPQQGTGIGLYMSKSIIEKNMGGKLSARNTATGAEFTIEV